MTADDDLDSRIADAVGALVDRAPPAPPFRPSTPAPPAAGRRGPLLVVAVVAVVSALVVGGIGWLSGDEADPEIRMATSSTAPSTADESTVVLEDPGLGLVLRAPVGWTIEPGDGVRSTTSFEGPTGEVLIPDWGLDLPEGEPVVDLPAGPARVDEVEGGVRVSIDVPCTWPPCRPLDVYAYGFSAQAVGATPEGERRALEVLAGLEVRRPTITGTLDDGRSFLVAHDLDRGLCTMFDGKHFGCDDTGPVVPRDADPSSLRLAALDVGPWAESDAGNLLYGVHPSPPLGPSTAGFVVPEYADGRDRTADVVVDPRTGLWALPVIPGDLPIGVTYLDESGTELGSVRLEEPR